jgi:DNA-binding transcriptional LysR family regulator
MFQGLDSSIDVRLLRVTHLLLQEQNVSRVASLLGLSQPAVSLSLKRARAVFGDPLLVRSGQRFVQTERGKQIYALLNSILDQLTTAVQPDEHFDPATAQLRMRVLAMNCFGGFIIPAVGASLRREAPGISVDFFSPNERSDLAEELAGSSDLVIGNWPAPPGSLRSSALLHCGIACVMHKNHPLSGVPQPELGDYLKYDHVSPTPLSNALYSPIDGRLAQLGLRRRVAISVPEYAQIPELLRETDLIFTTARPYAEYIAETAGHGELCVVAAPREFIEMHLYLLWHERSQNSPASQWLRGLIRGVAKRFDRSLHDMGAEGYRQGFGQLSDKGTPAFRNTDA